MPQPLCLSLLLLGLVSQWIPTTQSLPPKMPQPLCTSILFLGLVSQWIPTTHGLELNLTSLTGHGNGNTLRLRENNAQHALAVITVQGVDPVETEGVRCTVDDDNFAILNLNPREHLLLVAESLDRESVPRHDLEVSCHEVNGTDVGMQVTVLVEDANDNVPVFERARYDVSVQEEREPGYTLIQVKATDRDVGENGRIRYSLYPRWQTLFEIDAVTGVITALRAFDFEIERDVSTIAVATDYGNPPMETQVEVSIHLLDINDNSPISPEVSYHFQVSQGVAADTTVGTVPFVDRDYDENNRRVSLYLSPSRFFRMAGSEVKTARALDVSSVGTHQLTITAFDHGTPRRSSDVNVTVIVTPNVMSIL